MNKYIESARPTTMLRMLHFGCVLALVYCLANPASATPGSPTPISSNSNQPNAVECTMSADGTTVAFISDANAPSGVLSASRTIYLGPKSSVAAIARPSSPALLKHAFYNPKLSADSAGTYLTFEAYVSSLTGHGIVLYTNGSYTATIESTYNDVFPAVSTTGTVVFNSLSKGEIGICPLNGSPSYLTHDTALPATTVPAISADGSYVAYTNSSGALILYNTGSQAFSTIDAGSGCSLPSLSWAGDRIAYVKNGTVYVANKNGTACATLGAIYSGTAPAINANQTDNTKDGYFVTYQASNGNVYVDDIAPTLGQQIVSEYVAYPASNPYINPHVTLDGGTVVFDQWTASGSTVTAASVLLCGYRAVHQRTAECRHGFRYA